MSSLKSHLNTSFQRFDDVVPTHRTTQLAPQRWTDIRSLLLLLFCLPLVAIVLNVVRQLILPRRSTDPPVVFHWVPFIGSAIAYGNDPVKFLLDCQQKHGDIFTFVLLGRRMTVALGTKGNNFILGGKSHQLNAEDAYTHLTTPVFGKGVVYDVPNDVFMQQKKFCKVGFSISNLRRYVGMIEDEVHAFLAHDATFGGAPASTDASATAIDDTHGTQWRTFDALRLMQQLTILAASRTLQGAEVRAGLDASYAQLYSDLDEGFTPLNFICPNLPLPSYSRRDRAHRKMSAFYVDIVQRRRRRLLDHENEHEHDMIAALMKQTYRNGRHLEDHEVAHLMIAMLMAGQHTSSSTGSWALIHIANNPQIGEALYQEQVEHFTESYTASPSDGGRRPGLRAMTYEEVKELPLLNAVIRETLRLHPPIHSIIRYVREDVVVPRTLAAPHLHGSGVKRRVDEGDKGDGDGGDAVYVVPKGDYVLASPALSQIDARIWGRSADVWDPYRWIRDDVGDVMKVGDDGGGGDGEEKIDYGFGLVSKGTNSPYQPFGGGMHRCIGEQFAYLQLGVIVATLVRALEMRIERVPEPNYHTMITLPKSPREISFRRRRIREVD
ncbi:Lanosterol 14-alpha demethylase [Psilocybe cubensis]|uniref:Lanosterol 14-alpha demethylase n=1 Tax=Psilocybe cubensis TaxID=181762 RepID=A0ACB8GT53_PSICU|nr:Lanosterol 14-alpha demethylase [Psilocybe cubensis]KAH9478634.1 Lanosterol 14-alpha demethylase [Psilocybe cubensis]